MVHTCTYPIIYRVLYIPGIERLYIQLWLCFNLGDRAPIRIQKSQVPPHRPLQPPILALPHRRLLLPWHRRRLRHRCHHYHHPWQYWMLYSSSAANKWSCLGDGFKYFFGKISNLKNIFQLGWNHQRVVFLTCVFVVAFIMVQHLGGVVKANAAGSQCFFPIHVYESMQGTQLTKLDENCGHQWRRQGPTTSPFFLTQNFHYELWESISWYKNASPALKQVGQHWHLWNRTIHENCDKSIYVY